MAKASRGKVGEETPSLLLLAGQGRVGVRGHGSAHEMWLKCGVNVDGKWHEW